MRRGEAYPDVLRVLRVRSEGEADDGGDGEV